MPRWPLVPASPPSPAVPELPPPPVSLPPRPASVPPAPGSSSAELFPQAPRATLKDNSNAAPAEIERITRYRQQDACPHGFAPFWRKNACPARQACRGLCQTLRSTELHLEFRHLHRFERSDERVE